MLRILEPLPRFGVGVKVSKTKWHDDSFWHILDVRPKRKSFVSQSGDAPERLVAGIYGVKYWNGQPDTGRVMRIRGQMKQIWRQVGLSDHAAKMAKLADVLDQGTADGDAASAAAQDSAAEQPVL